MAIQEFFTSRNNGIDDPAEFVGKEGRLWYDPDTNTIKVYDGNEGGQTVGGGGGGNGSPGGTNRAVQFNDGGSFGGRTSFTYNKLTDTLTIGTISANTISASGSVTGNNITSNGSANITGNLTANNITSNNALGANTANIGNLTVTGNANVGGILTDNYYYANGSPVDFQGAAGSNTYVQFNSNGDFGASANFTFNSSTNILTVIGSANLGNLATANFFSGTLTTSAQPNITSVGTLTSLAVTGNTITGNLKLNGGLTTNRSNVAVLPNTFSILDQFTPSSYRTAKYIISAEGDYGYQSVEAILVHDGLDSYITVYGSVCSNITADIIDISSNINGLSGNVAVYASTLSGNTKVNLVAAYILPTA